MPTATWKKSPPDLIERFAAALQDHPKLVRRPMFGYPAAFLNGSMVAGLFQDRVVVRVGHDAAAALVAQGRAETFAPMPGRAMKGFVLVPHDAAQDAARLADWLAQGLAHVVTLPAKAGKAAKDKAVARSKTAKAAKTAAG